MSSADFETSSTAGLGSRFVVGCVSVWGAKVALKGESDSGSMRMSSTDQTEAAQCPHCAMKRGDFRFFHPCGG